MIWLFLILSSPLYGDELEIIEKGTDREILKASEKSTGVVQLTDEFYPAFSISTHLNLSGNFRIGSVEANLQETFKMADGGVNASIMIPVTINEYRPGNNSQRSTPRIGGGPLPELKFGFEVYRKHDEFGEFGAKIFLPYDSSNSNRFGIMMMGSYKHRLILGRFVIDAKFSAGTSFSKETTNSSSLFGSGSNSTTEQEPVFNSSLELFPYYSLNDSLGIIFGGVWSYRGPARATQNGTVVYSQSAENNLGLGAGVYFQTGQSSYLSPLFYRIVAPPSTEERNNIGLMLTWQVYI